MEVFKNECFCAAMICVFLALQTSQFAISLGCDTSNQYYNFMYRNRGGGFNVQYAAVRYYVVPCRVFHLSGLNTFTPLISLVHALVAPYKFFVSLQTASH